MGIYVDLRRLFIGSGRLNVRAQCERIVRGMCFCTNECRRTNTHTPLFLPSHCISHLPPCLCVSAHLITPTVSISSFLFHPADENLYWTRLHFPERLYNCNTQRLTSAAHHPSAPPPCRLPPPLTPHALWSRWWAVIERAFFDVFNRHKDANYPWDLRRSCVCAEMTPFASLCRRCSKSVSAVVQEQNRVKCTHSIMHYNEGVAVPRPHEDWRGPGLVTEWRELPQVCLL